MQELSFHAFAAGSMKRPEGSMVSKSVRIYGPDIIQVVAGAHVFRVFLEVESRQLTFVHSSPGTGTRATRADVAALYPEMLEHESFLALTWSPDELSLHVGLKALGADLIKSGATVGYLPKLVVDRSGGVHEIGDVGVQVSDARVWVGGQEELTPSAVDLWESTREWARAVLDVLQEDSPFHVEVAVCNAAFVSLVSGYEVYLQKRFVELEREGLPLDLLGLRKRLPREMARTEDVPEKDRVSALARAVNFQSWTKAKVAFAASYGLVFGQHLAALDGGDFERIQRLLKYRHRIIHAQPMSSFLNPMFPAEEPEFSGRALVMGAEESLSRFIAALHDASLRLRPRDNNAPSP